MSAPPSPEDIAKASELMEGAGALIPRALAAQLCAQALADARAEAHTHCTENTSRLVEAARAEERK